MSDESFRVVRLGEVEPISVAGVHWLPLRRRLGVGPFGINGYTANAGEELIEEHDETGSGAGAHEEAYVVVSGRATFTVDGQEVDAPAGTIVFVKDLAARRHAIAAEDGTTALVIRRPAGERLPGLAVGVLLRRGARLRRRRLRPRGRDRVGRARRASRPSDASLPARLLPRARRTARAGARAPAGRVRGEPQAARRRREGQRPRFSARRRLAVLPTDVVNAADRGPVSD